MRRFIIYLFPLLIDMALSTMFFVCSLRMAESGASAFAVSMVCTVWALTYSITAAMAGRFINSKNAAGLVIGACFSVALISVLFIILPGLWIQYLLMICSGVAVALFFTPFQIFMKEVMGQISMGLEVSAGLYTFAWSMGMALGPFVSGFLWEHFGWQSCHAVNCAAAVISGIGIIVMNRYTHTDVQIGEPQMKIAKNNHPDLVMLGWICGAVCFLAVSMFRAVFPSQATALTVGKVDQGIVFALLFAGQGLTGLTLCWFKKWLYQSFPMMLFSIVGIVGYALFIKGTTPPVFFLGALLIGIYSGSVCCYFVFHSLVHPEKSAKNVAVNEAIVGVTGIVGPLAGGVIADTAGLSAPYLTTSLLIVLFIIIFRLQFRCRTKIKTRGDSSAA